LLQTDLVKEAAGGIQDGLTPSLTARPSARPARSSCLRHPPISILSTRRTVYHRSTGDARTISRKRKARASLRAL